MKRFWPAALTAAAAVAGMAVPQAVLAHAAGARISPPMRVGKYRNADTLEARVDHLFAKLTEREKLSLLSGTGFTTQPIPRLGIPALGMVDGPRGVRGGIAANNGPATLFPEPIAMAATWNPDLISRAGRALGEEALNKGAGAQVLLGPCVNIERSPLWGRAGESFGEDPWLTSRIAVGYIDGVQSSGAAACIKHYACNNEEADRNTVDVQVDERALREIYLPAFHAGITEGHVWTLMAAYNMINGYHATANRYLLTDILRHEWGFDGLAMSDWGAVHETGGVVNAGLDLEMPGGGDLTVPKLEYALHDGEISQQEIDTSVKRILRTIIRTGLMDGKRRKPNHAIVDSPEHRRVDFETAAESMVLLKNQGDALPLDRKSVKSIAVIGPLADTVNFGISGSSFVSPTYYVTPLAGLKKAAGPNVTIQYAPGCGVTGAASRLPNDVPADVFTPLRSPSRHGLTAEYFTNQNLTGSPALKRTDANIDFDWSKTSPAPSIPREHFSVRWTGTLTAPVTGSYELGATADDGVRVFIDNKLVIDHWQNGSADTTYTSDLDLIQGRSYKVRVEYYQDSGDASVRLAWLRPGETLRPLQDASYLAARCDAAVVFVGTAGYLEGEGFDRKSMDLPGRQNALIQAVAAANKRTIVVVSSGGPCTMSAWADQAPAIIQSWNAGQETGNAIAGILFGDVNPSGKLPTTFGLRRQDYPDYGNFPGKNGRVRYAEGIFVGYRHFDKAGITPMFPFGHGLSYTTFRYHNIRFSSTRLGRQGAISVSVDVTNTGSRRGKEVVQLYLHDPHPKIDKAVRELKGFEKIDLAPGETKTARFTITPSMLAYVDAPHRCWRADPGTYDAQIGASSRNIRLQGAFTLTETYLQRVSKAENRPVDLDEGYAARRPATASSTQDDFTPANAVDGDPSTRWGSKFSDPQWLAVDLGRMRTIRRVRISWEDAYASSYAIQTSTDGRTWRTVYSTDHGGGGTEQVRFAPVSARWVRLFCRRRSTPWGDSVFSFGVYGK